jgi:hypothetical protein
MSEYEYMASEYEYLASEYDYEYMASEYEYPSTGSLQTTFIDIKTSPAVIAVNN